MNGPPGQSVTPICKRSSREWMERSELSVNGKATKMWERGEQEIIKIVEGERIESELRFLKPFKSTSDAYIETIEVGTDRTKVIWGFSGKNVFPMSIVMLFMSMDKAVGKDFEEGLASLKQNLENS